MKNFVQEGLSLDCIAPAGGVKAGMAYLLGSIIAVAATSAAEGEPFAGWTEGVYDLPSDTGTAWAFGDKVYLLADGSKFTKTAAGNTKAGQVAAVKEAGAEVGRIKLVPTI